MADRVSVSIAIGGSLASTSVDELVRLAQAERLSTEWGGEPFDHDQFPTEGPLRLYGQEVRNGELADLEDFCCANDLPFVRWSGGASGAFGPEVVVWTGEGDRRSFAADEDENIVLSAAEARELGSYEAITQHFTEGDFEPPPLRIADPRD